MFGLADSIVQPLITNELQNKAFACDGTKLGMFFENVSLKGFERPTSDCVVRPNVTFYLCGKEDTIFIQ